MGMWCVCYLQYFQASMGMSLDSIIDFVDKAVTKERERGRERERIRQREHLEVSEIVEECQGQEVVVETLVSQTILIIGVMGSWKILHCLVAT